MTKTQTTTEPWRGLPPEVADVIEPELSAVAEEILTTIAREVPDYARPFEGSFGRGVQMGVTEALRQFVALIRDPDSGREPGRDVYVNLGRGELRQGRALDALQSAYRVGARVAWRRLAQAARGAGLDAEVLSTLAESIFAYIEELSADSVEGYAEARSEREGERQRRRRELIALLLRDPPPADPDELERAAGRAGWTLPRGAAVLACSQDSLGRLTRRLPPDVISAGLRGVGCAIVPDPEGPGRLHQVTQAAEGAAAALGPSCPLAGLAESWTLATSTLAAMEDGAIADRGLVRAEDRLGDLLLYENAALVERIAQRRLAALEELTGKSRARMEDTALAYLRRQGNAAAMAESMEVHAQTARYRLARLRGLLGEQLDDPESRFELELCLRERLRRRGAKLSADG
jgi:PucR C-terminal helix-turn-helix domain